MKIKEFEALTLKDCLHQVREEMGPEAVILETKKTFGWLYHRELRIAAAQALSKTDPRYSSQILSDSGLEPAELAMRQRLVKIQCGAQMIGRIPGRRRAIRQCPDHGGKCQKDEDETGEFGDVPQIPPNSAVVRYNFCFHYRTGASLE